MSRSKTPFCMDHPDIGPELRAMVPTAVTAIRQALERGRADRAAVDMARWVLTTVAEGDAEGKASKEAADGLELEGALLQLVPGGK